jgi:SAM-dependent methyltransferase
VAEWWAAFNDDFRPHEVDYYRDFLEDGGQPALDAGCGSGRLLLPYLRAGFDVDGCDVSADMVAACRRKAAAEGLEPDLYVQPMHAIDLPRIYRTIYVCGSFGLGSDRARDTQALERFREHLEPGGMLLIDIEVPYADPEHWQYWPKLPRAVLPEASQPPERGRRAVDGAEYGLSTRLVGVDPLEQRVTMEIHARRWRGGELEAEERHVLHIGMYFPHELLLMLERAGFSDVEVHGEHQRRPPTSDDDFLVMAARR